MPSPPAVQGWLSFGQAAIEMTDRPAGNLGFLLCRFVDLSAYLKRSLLRDGQSRANSVLRKMLDLDADLLDWERERDGIWLYEVHHAQHLAQEAVFEGEYHIYYDMFYARVWNHYRWARLLLNQLMIEFQDKHPLSSHSFPSANDRHKRLFTIRTLVRDILISTPSHWRHPLLPNKTTLAVIRQEGGGSGAGGLPVHILHLKAAACVPDIPGAYTAWAQRVVECIWSDMGMFHAKATLEAMRKAPPQDSKKGVEAAR